VYLFIVFFVVVVAMFSIPPYLIARLNVMKLSNVAQFTDQVTILCLQRIAKDSWHLILLSPIRRYAGSIEWYVL